MAQALTVQAPSLCPTVSSTYHAVPVRFRVTRQKREAFAPQLDGKGSIRIHTYHISAISNLYFPF